MPVSALPHPPPKRVRVLTAEGRAHASKYKKLQARNGALDALVVSLQNYEVLMQACWSMHQVFISLEDSGFTPKELHRVLQRELRRIDRLLGTGRFIGEVE